MLNRDYKDILREFSAKKVKFLLVGAYAMAAHGYPRATLDMDLWVMPSHENARAVLRALERFGAHIGELTSADLETEGNVFQIGFAPRRIDIITAASGLEFGETFKNSALVEIEGIDVHVPAIEDLIKNKKATGRAKDLADVEALEALRNRTDA